MRAIQVITALAACAAIATPVSADVTLRSKRTTTHIGGTFTDAVTEYRKGLKMRTDSSGGGLTSGSIISDAATGRLVMLWPDGKSAHDGNIHDKPPVVRSAGVPEVKQSITPTGESRQIAGWTCTVYHFKSSVRYPQWEKDEAVILILEGSMCLVKDGPGQADFSAYSRSPNALASDHLRMTTPQITDLGVPFATDMRLRMGGDEMTKEVSHSTTEVLSVSTVAIPDSVFEIPADYTVRKR